MTSADFTRWIAFLAIEPCMETRVDYLSGALAALIGRVEATLGGKPPRPTARLIEWDRRPQDDDEAMVAFLQSFGKKGAAK